MKKGIWLLTVVFFLGFIILIRDQLLTKGVEVYLSRKIESQGWKCSLIERDKNTLKIQDLHYQSPSEEIFIEGATASIHLSLFPLQLKPIVTFSHVAVKLSSEQSSDASLLSVLLCTGDPRLDLQLSIADGEIEGLFKEPVSFSFQPALEKGGIGTLCMKDGEKHSIFSSYLKWENGSLLSQIEIEKGNVSDLFTLVSWISPATLAGCKQVEGEVSASIETRLHPKKGLEGMEGKIDLQNLSFSHTDLGMDFFSRSLQGTLFLASDDWNTAEFFITFEDASCHLEKNGCKVGLQEALGEIRIQPETDPYLRMGGMLLSEGSTVPFEIEGKGSLEEGKKSFQLAADFFLKRNSPHLFVRFFEKEKQGGNIEIQCRALSEEVFNILQLSFPVFHVPLCSMHSGLIDGKCQGSLRQGKIQSLTFSDCSAENLSFSLPAKNLACSLQQGFFSASLEQNGESLELSSLDVTLEKANVSISGVEKLRLVSGSVAVASGDLQASSVEGFYEGIWGKIQVLEPEASDFLHVEGKALSSDLTAYLGYKTSSKGCPVTFALDVAQKEKNLQGRGALCFVTSTNVGEDIALQLSLDKKASRKIKDLCMPWDFSSCKGFFSVQKISAETITVLAKPYLGSLTLEGFARGEGSFDSKALLIDLLQANVSLLGGPWDINAKMGSQEKIGHISYVYREGLWKGSLPVDVLHVYNKALQMDAKVRDTLFFFEGEQLWTDSLQAEVLGTKFLGSALVHPKEVHIASKAWQGDLASLNPLLTRYAPKIASLGLSGAFAIKERACTFEGKKENDQWKWDWKGAIDLAELACDFGSLGKVFKGTCRLQGSSQGEFALKELQGMYSLPTATCFFSLGDMQWDSSFSHPVDFYLRAKDRKREWASLQGKIEKQPDGIALSFLSHSHLLGLPVQILPIGISSKGTIAPIYATSNVNLKQLSSYLTMWKEMGVPVAPFPGLESCQGSLQIQAAYDPSHAKWKIALQSPEIVYENQALGKVAAVFLGEKGLVRIDTCRIGAWEIQGSVEKLATEWNIPSVTVEGPKGKYAFKGRYLPTSCQLQIPMFSAALTLPNVGSVQLQGNFEGIYQTVTSSLQGRGVSRCSATLPLPLEVGIETNKDIPFILDSSKGIEMGRSEWSFVSLTKKKQKLGKFSAKTMSYLVADKKFFLREGSLYVPKDSHPLLQSYFPQLKEVQIEQGIDLQTEIDLAPQYRKVTAIVKNGSYSIKNTSFDCKQLYFFLEQEKLYASCQTKWQDLPLHVQMQVQLAKQLSLNFLVKDHPDSKGLASEWKQSSSGKWVCETVDGVFRGIDLHMKRTQKDRDKQLYNCKVQADFAEVASLLPKEWKANVKKWGLGRGYSFQGTVACHAEDPLQIVSLQGELFGERFGLFGKSLELFQAKVDFTPQKTRIQGLKIADGQAQLSIKNLDFTFNSEIKAWEVASPLISVKNFAPAAVFKGSKAKGFEIKNLSFYDVKGSLNQLEKLEGRGALYFASPTKKEFSFWDVPLALVKDLGLDPGLLTPVMGEADFVLRHGRVYFTSLRNVYSEGKRSQFYLSPTADSAYLSLTGDWHVDLSMKQNVVWKVTEDLILSIRGTLEKPKYSFTSNKNAREGD